jgi:DtxR family manganese transport transcriptional regulator
MAAPAHNRRGSARKADSTDRPRTGDQAPYHRRTRQAHKSELAEDYVEAIADLIDSDGEARVVDLAHCLGVTHVTVIRTISRLAKDGLVNTRPYRSIFLTDEGRALADRVRHRHEVVLRFLRAVGVDEETARADAEGIEHHVSAKTLAAFERYVARP